MANRNMRRNYGTVDTEVDMVHADNLPPYPTKQLLVLALCRICEPIAFMSIFPYIWHMVKDFNITDDESKISFYAGLVTSSFTFAEFLTSVFWGRLSDRIGRKPVLLMGMGGTGLSVLAFGFAPSLQVALLARALGGFLNGNLGVLQTTVAELVTVKEHQPRAYSVMPTVWCIGSILGPMIGGALAKPVESLPWLFSQDSIWGRFPYLFPNVVSATFVFMGVVIGVLFLEETHAEKRRQRDRGVELGNYFVGQLTQLYRREPKPRSAKGKSTEDRALLFEDDEPLPGYLTTQDASRLAPTAGSMQQPSDLETAADPSAAMPTRVFTKQVVLILASYGVLAFHTMAFDALLPVFLSTNPPDQPIPTSLPFKFVDGFGLDTKTIGVILSFQGVYSMASTCFLFPRTTSFLGPLRLFRMMSILYPFLYFTAPYVVLLPKNLRMCSIYALVVWKCTFSTLAYPSNAILLSNSAPSNLTLGMINGVGAMTASACRALGPTVAGFFYTKGMESGYSILSWWIVGLVTIAGAYISIKIQEPRGRLDEKMSNETAPVPRAVAPSARA